MPPEEVARFVAREGDIRVGVKRRVLVPAPALGADWSVKVPGGVYWRPGTIQAKLTASAVVANRQPRLVFGDGNVNFAAVEVATSITASQAVTFLFVAGLIGSSAGVSGNFPNVGIPQIVLENQSTIASTTTAIDVGDQWSQIVLDLEEFYLTAEALQERAADRVAADEAVARALEAGGATIPGLAALPG